MSRKYTRRRLWEAQDRRCFYCRTPIEFAEATTDHVRPVCKMGRSVWDNLVAACEPCNTLKGSREPDWLLQRLGIQIPFTAYREMTLAPILVSRNGKSVNVGGNRSASFEGTTSKRELVRQKVRKLALERDQEAAAKKETEPS